MGLERVWQATPKQDKFLCAEEDEIMYGGAAGGGKTDSLLIDAALTCLDFPGAHVLYLRRAYPDLEMSAIKRSLELFTGIGAKYDGTKYRWKFPHRDKTSVLQFGYLEADKDVFRYQSAEFDKIYFDELTQFSEFQYTYMLSRNRTTIAGMHPQIKSGTNPGGVGHAWVKKRFVDPTMKGERIFTDPETGRTRRFIKARLEDNPHLTTADPGYEKRMLDLPESMRKALREGDWDIAVGVAFPEFSYSIHVVKPFLVPAFWPKWLSNDPGYTDPYAWYCFTVGPDKTVYIYREITRKPGQERMVYSDQARMVIETCYSEDPETGEKYAEVFDFKTAGRDAFSRHPESGKCIIDYYAEGGLTGFLEPPRAEKTDRKMRKATFHEYLKPYEDNNFPVKAGEPPKMTAKLKIFDTCTKLIETLPVLVEDPNDPEKVALSDLNHWYDGAGYGLVKWHAQQAGIPEKPKGLIAQYKEKLAATGRFARRRRWY